MLDCLTRIKDIRPLIDRRYKDGEWRFHRNSCLQTAEKNPTTNARNEKARL
jgi:hypothetical protein